MTQSELEPVEDAESSSMPSSERNFVALCGVSRHFAAFCCVSRQNANRCFKLRDLLPNAIAAQLREFRGQFKTLL